MDINDYSWHVPPPGDLMPVEKTAWYKTSLDWRNVTEQTIRRWRRFPMSKKIVLRDTGKTVDETDNIELAKFIIKRQKEARKSEKTDAEKRSSATKHQTSRGGKVEDRLESYLSHYDAKTANDMASLRQLCSLELALEDLEKTEQTLLRSLKDPAQQGKYSESYINSIVNARLKYLAEYRQLQMMLGIDRQGREKLETEKGGADYTKELIQSGYELLKSKSVPIVCPVCKSNGTILAQGFILSHFPNFSFVSICPKCNGKIEISRGSTDTALLAGAGLQPPERQA